MTFLRTIFSRFNGSGLAALAVASGIISAGSVDQVLKGNHFKRGMRMHKLVYECLVRRLIQKAITMSPRLEEKFKPCEMLTTKEARERMPTMKF